MKPYGLQLGALFLSAVAVAPAATPAECADFRRHGKLDAAVRCFSELTASRNAAERAEGYWGLERYQEANDNFRLASSQEPENADYRVRWGLMFLERYQEADAADLFWEALKLDGDHAGAYFGLARVSATAFEQKAVELAEKALEKDPDLLGARELLAHLALEDNNEEKAREEALKALEMSAEALDAMAVLASMDWLGDKDASPWMERILKVNPVYGEAYATAGHFFVLNRRYEEGIAFYRKALDLNPRLWKARSELGVNLMRLAREEEAREHLEACYENGFRDAATVNTLRLMDSYKNFESFETANSEIRLHREEADVLRPYFEAELQRAIATYEKKYRMKLSGPVRLEVYPDHEDFAVRTMGMPGLGALGVTFGRVVAMDSPSGRKPGEFHWASTLWHELSHVFVLEATKHRVPRWFTEGLAVHEETATSPEWGDRLNSTVIKALAEDKLLPVAALDRGFIRPSYPGQVVVSYYQAGKICDYINERWGWNTLLAMIADFGDKKGTPEVIRGRLEMEPEEFDNAFREWLDASVKQTVEGYEQWKKDIKELVELAAAGKNAGVLEKGPAVRDAFPDYVEANSAYELIANSSLALGLKDGAREELEKYMRAGGRSPAVLKQLARLQEEAGMERDAARTLGRINYVYPVNDEELHRWLGDLAFEDGAWETAIREYGSVVAMNPIDKASSEYNLAKAYKAAGRREEALEHVVLALEEAPGYRPAQKMLLELSSGKKE